ncbi:MAG: 4-hydroxy-3-methylbut-2-enyl diphosphate reductase [Lachnospirales bacterium]
MNVIVAKTAGFCFGVKRAVDFAYSKAGQKNIYTYAPIIHNKEVTKDLEKKGIKIIDNLEDGKNGEIIIRSHGVPPSVYDTLDKENIKYTDCTCPFVKKIHNIVRKSYIEENKSIIIVGSGEHPEVVGINGECNNTAIIVDSVETAEKLELDKNVEYALVVQTTFQIDVYNKIILTLSQKSDNIKVNNTICSATSDRQKGSC